MSPALFSPIKVGAVELSHKVVLAPLTRYRGLTKINGVHGPTAKEYYTQRASFPGSLLITEGTFISAKAGGYSFVPGIWNSEQVAKWKEISDAVHSQGSKIFMQLWQLGRAADEKTLKSIDPSYQLVSSSSIPLKGAESIVPHSLTTEEIKEYVRSFATAATNAIEAGMDGVEIHGANGYLVDQFIQSVSNHRTDAYGGSVENRARFVLEVIEAITKAVGQERVGIRFSPYGEFQDMGMPIEDIHETFGYIVTQLKERFGNMAYIHLVEPRAQGAGDKENVTDDQSNDFIRDIWSPRPLISAGGYNRDLAFEVADKHNNELVAFGRDYISNPDLPRRLKENLKLTPTDRTVYYLKGEHTGKGYTDWPFAAESKL